MPELPSWNNKGIPKAIFVKCKIINIEFYVCKLR